MMLPSLVALRVQALWLVEKYAELHLEARWNGWVLLLLFSLCGYKGALLLHANPAFVASMFGSS